MRFALTDDQQAFASAVHDLMVRTCPPSAVRAAWDRESALDLDRWSRLAQMGVLGLAVPEAHGGLEMGAVSLVAVLEETGRAALPEPVVEHAAVAAPLLAAVAGAGAPGSARAAEWAQRAAAGEVVLSVQARATPHVIAADVADAVVLTHDHELHLVDRADLTLTAQASVDGARRLFEVGFVPSEATLLVGGVDELALLDAAFDFGALGTAAQLVGLADAMISMTVGYVTERRQFGVPIGSFQAVKHHLADALLRTEFARPAVLRAAATLDAGGPERARDVSMAKAMASDAALGTAKVALQCHGAIGYTVEHDLHLFMKRAWALAAQWGDAAWHRRRVALSVLGPPAA